MTREKGIYSRGKGVYIERYLSLLSAGINGANADATIPSLLVSSPNIMHDDDNNEVVVVCCEVDVDGVAVRLRRGEGGEETSPTSRDED